MLSPAQIARMAAAASFESAFGVLTETTYAEHHSKLKNPFDFEELFEFELLSLKKLMETLAPQHPVIKVLFEKYDYLNLKIILRAHFAGIKIPARLSAAGTIDPDYQDILEAADEAKADFEKNKNPQILDFIIDKHYYSRLKRIFSLSPSRLIRNAADSMIDLINLKTILRAQELKLDKNFLKSALLETAIIDPDILLDLYDKNPHEIILRLSFTPYFPAIAEGIEYFIKTGSFHQLEKRMDDFITNRFRKAKYLSSGTEPLVGFIWAKENEIKTLRFILVSKKNYIDSERIKERLRASYA